MVSTVDFGRDEVTVYGLTNNIDGQHTLSNVPNGPVTNGVMSLGASSEGSFVADHGYDERLSPHVTPDNVTLNVTPGTNGPTPLNAHENGHDTQEHFNEANSTANSTGVESAASSVPPEHEVREEKSEIQSTRDAEHVELEQAPQRDRIDGLPVTCASGSPAEEKEATQVPQEDSIQPSITEIKSDSAEQQTLERETSKSPEKIETNGDEEPMDEN